MNLHLSDAPGLNLFTAYGAGYVAVCEKRYGASLIVLPGKIITDWSVECFAALDSSHFAAILEWEPEVVLLGTGNLLRFPHPGLTEPLIRAQIGLEVMNTPSACRTYNLLASEGRRVAAAILLEP